MWTSWNIIEFPKKWRFWQTEGENVVISFLRPNSNSRFLWAASLFSHPLFSLDEDFLPPQQHSSDPPRKTNSFTSLHFFDHGKSRYTMDDINTIIRYKLTSCHSICHNLDLPDCLVCEKCSEYRKMLLINPRKTRLKCLSCDRPFALDNNHWKRRFTVLQSQIIDYVHPWQEGWCLVSAKGDDFSLLV